MRIAIVTSTFLPDFIGGREKHVYGLSKSLMRLGYDVRVFAGSHTKGLINDEYDAVPVTKVPLFTINLFGVGEKIPYRLVSPSFISALRAFNPDIIHAHDYRHFTTDLAALYARCADKPLVITVHGFFYKPSIITQALMQIYDKLFGLLTLKTAKKIITVSSKFQRDIPTNFKDKVLYIPNAVLVDQVKNDARSFREVFSIPSWHKMILAVGRVVRQKGFDTLIRAFHEAQNIKRSITLVVVGPVGDDNYFNDLKSMVRENDNVIFTGVISDNLLMRAYEESDVMVIPSLDEGLPTVLLEAIAYQKPVIASSVGMMPEIVENGVNGILVEPGHYLQLSQAIYKVLTDKELRIRLKKGACRVLQKYDWNNVVRLITEVYDEVLSKQAFS